MKPPRLPLGLYIHIPFCKQKCTYCDFYSLAGSEQEMDAYVQAVTTHLKETAPFAKNHIIDTVYFGGGTPTFLGEKRLIILLKAIGKYYRLAVDAEITIEANPDTAQNWRTLRRLRRAGCNRISLGMQSANEKELWVAGRIHTMDQVRTSVEAVRKANIKNISLDLIYGLPDQTMDEWQTTLNAALALNPDHLSCYGLKLEENTPLFEQQDTLEFPSEDTQAELYLHTVEFLADNGYMQYEISNFSKKGYHSRHNLKYWTLGEYAGFGPSAHSDFGGVRYGYGRDLQGYIDAVNNGKKLVSESTVLPEDARDTEWLMLGLRTVRGICPKTFERRFRRSFNCFLPFLRQCTEAGYVIEDAHSWHLTPTGFLVSNQIIGGMLDALAEDKARRATNKANKNYRIVP